MEKMFEKILSGGYKSPIEIIMGQMRTEVDDGIYKAIQGYGVNVDKEELIRALQFDRGQYEKGYADGLHHRESEWISVEERLPETSGSYIVCTDKGGVCTAHFYADCGRFNAPFGKSVVYWMPLPEPPKGE